MFSKNRALQLYALLESMFALTDMPEKNVTVLHKYEGPHARTLTAVRRDFPRVRFVRERNFRSQTLRLLRRSRPYVMFLVDDIVFKECLRFRDVLRFLEARERALAVSLRLGLHITWCYALAQPEQVPQGEQTPDGFFVWDWREAEMDWNYPLSLDGHVFRRRDILPMVEEAAFTGPNSLEANLQPLPQKLDLHECASFTTARLMNLPFNRVQHEMPNRSGEVSAEFMLAQWQKGLKLDILPVRDCINIGVHEECPPSFVQRLGTEGGDAV